MLYILSFLSGCLVSSIILTILYFKAIIKFEIMCENKYKEKYRNKLQDLMTKFYS